MTVLSVNKPFETDTPSLVVENKLAVGAYRFQLVVVGASGVQSDPAVAVVQVIEGRVIPPVGPVVQPPIVVDPLGPIARSVQLKASVAKPAKAAKPTTAPKAAKKSTAAGTTEKKSTPAASTAKKTTTAKKATKPTTKRRGGTQ